MINPLSDNTYIPPSPVLPGTSSNPTNKCCGEASIGSNGVETFIELYDAPNSYAGQAGKIVGVNNTETGLEFVEQASSGWRPAQRISRDDSRWTPNDYTFTDVDLIGAVFFVYYNGSKILTPELEGFAILDSGGFTFDPTRFQFYEGEFLYLIF